MKDKDREITVIVFETENIVGKYMTAAAKFLLLLLPLLSPKSRPGRSGKATLHT